MIGRSLVVSLIGRPNVGKSTLFNRLIGRQNKALTYDRPGVTRDRHYGLIKSHDFKETPIILIDTGGLFIEKLAEQDEFGKEIHSNQYFNIMKKQALVAMEESDFVIFMVDVKDGALPVDTDLIAFLREKKCPFVVVANKCDSEKWDGQVVDFYQLGINDNELIGLSAAHGRGVDDLHDKLHEVAENLDRKESPFKLSPGVAPRESVVAKVALIGGPNAGKSTLLNQLIKADRALVSPIPGTTIDPIDGFMDLYFGPYTRVFDNVKSNRPKSVDEEYEVFQQNNPDYYERNEAEYYIKKKGGMDYSQVEEVQAEEEDSLETLEEFDFENKEEEQESSYWRAIHIVDTAGIRKQKLIKDYVEEQAVYRSLRCIAEADVVCYLVDAKKGIGHQDCRLLDIAIEKGKSVILVMNKMDLMRKDLKTKKDKSEWFLDLRDRLPWLDYCHIVTISAKSGYNLNALKKELTNTILARMTKIPTGTLNRALAQVVARHNLVVKGQRGTAFKLRFATQLKSDPPTFLLYSNRSRNIPENYRRFIKRGIREHFQLQNTPIHLIFRRSGEDKLPDNRK